MLDLERIITILRPCPEGLARLQEIKAAHPGLRFAEFWRVMCQTEEGRAACAWACLKAHVRTCTSGISGEDYLPTLDYPPVESVDLIAVQRGLAQAALRKTWGDPLIRRALENWDPTR